MLRASHVPFMKKVLRKAIMKTSDLQKKYVINETNIKNRGICSVNHIKKEGKILWQAWFKDCY